MLQEHGPKFGQTYNKGANSDTEIEFSGSETNGEYRASQNARPVDISGNIGALKKISGHELFHDLTSTINAISSTYLCLAEEDINGKKVCFWASPNNGEYPAISIDGIIACKSENLPLKVEFPGQTDKNENCLGGEVFYTDFNSQPMIFNIQDMLDAYNSGDQKYFSEFNINQYVVNLSAPLDIPVFEELVNVGSGGGLPIGSYSYSIRYVNQEGDRTNFGPSTPLIAVPRDLNEDSTQYPYSLTVGGAPDNSVKTSFGIKLKFRVNNELNYDFIEVRRYSWNSNTGENFTPEGVIVARLDVVENEFSTRTFIDPLESNTDEVISDEEETVQLAFIERAKGVRYYDKRLVLMNIETGSRDYEPTFEEDSQNRYMYPTMQKMYKAGHNDPYNRTYYKNYTGGESFAFAISAFDGVGGKGFAVPIPNNVTGDFNYVTPNRRTEVPNLSEEDLYSYEGTVTAANTQGGVTKTLEVFDHEDAVSKQDVCTLVGIGDPPDPAVGGQDDGKTNATLNAYCATPPQDRGATRSISNPFTEWQSGYRPLTPVSVNDNNVTGHGVVPNTKVDLGSGEETYRPEGFSLDYYSRGFALHGIDGFPEWAKAFTVSRTKRANRVICQGLGMWALNEASNKTNLSSSNSTKETERLWFYSPDIEAGLVSQAIIDGIANGDYKVQFVSPLGFFSEVYNGANPNALNPYDEPVTTAVDMISYARILHDEGQFNPGSDVSGYVYYNKWRNPDPINGNIFAGADGGDVLVPVTDFEVKSDGQGVFYEMELNSNIYNDGGSDSGSTLFNPRRNFNDTETKRFQEPFYVINIVQEGATQTDQDIDSYIDTGAYVKLESRIALSTSGSDVLELVDERWEDCVPALDASSSLAGNERFTYVRNANGVEEAWLNVTFKTPAEVTAIINDIINNGFYLTPIRGVQVYGVYTHTITQNAGEVKKNVVLNFNVVGSEIPAGLEVYVKYDKESPVRVFGGDSLIGESVFAIRDREALGEDTSQAKEDAFSMGIPFPYMGYEMNPSIYQISNSKPLNIQDWGAGSNIRWARTSFIRQMIMNFTSESRADTNYQYSLDAPLESFPRINYIMRPHKFDDSLFAGGDRDAIYQDNNINTQYGDDYGDEYLRWKAGGFRFLGQFNNDYTAKPPIEFFSKKQFGFEEETEFCTRIIWSQPRQINQQDSPSLKTFLSTSVFDIKDDNGEIKKAYDEHTGKGNNLYAFTNSGICLLLTSKSILSNINADELSVMAGDSFIGEEYWLDEYIGMNDETWRSHAEASLAINTDSGIARTEGIFWANNQSVYRMSDNQLIDIGRSNYYATLNPLLKTIKSGYQSPLCGYYDEKYDEYGFQVSNRVGEIGEIFTTEHHVFSQRTNAWIGTRDYNFDRYLFSNGELYGMKDGKVDITDEGLLINGVTINYNVLQACSPQPLTAKEFIRIFINSDNKPTRVLFYDKDENFLCSLDEASKGPLYLKNYNNWEQFIPRKDLAVDPEQKRVQDRAMLFRIFHEEQEEFRLISTEVQYKILK